MMNPSTKRRLAGPKWPAWIAAAALLCSVAASRDSTASISRARFAAAYLRFETALRGVTLGPAEAIRVNKTFDALTLLFFTGSLAKAMENLDALTASIDPQAPPAPATSTSPPAKPSPTPRAKKPSPSRRGSTPSLPPSRGWPRPWRRPWPGRIFWLCRSTRKTPPRP